MSFSIIVKNDGDEGTVTVTEVINNNERRVVFDDVLSEGESRQIANCLGTPPKKFEWLHHATNLSGDDTVDDGGTLHVSS